MKLSGVLLHSRACCLSKGLAECSLPVLLSCPWSPKLSPVSPSNSNQKNFGPVHAGHGDVTPTGMSGKSTSDGTVNYIVNPARHRHSVCTLEGPCPQPRPRTGHQPLLLTPNTKFSPAATLVQSPCNPSPVVSMERGGVNCVTSPHRIRYHLDNDQGLTVKTTPTPHPPESPGRVPHGDDMPSPAQLSVILLKLREELPSFFSDHHHHHSYSMYSPDVVFINNLLPFSWTLYSRWSYRCFLNTSRLLLRVRYSRLNLDLIRISKDGDAGKVEARWRIKGRPRLKLNDKVILDGYSEFRVNSSGLISQHHMDCMMPSKRRARSKVPQTLISDEAPLAS